ncbi:related to methyltransferase [Phialocephala subalpina]|uniref:Related to methyltransferase n=1 Tax=Phialocephala subalpina TaxID=576137 RepID=A0A1L7WU30_9HELO|nr:related to methyltransferase [Phialocephala subalpina]
MAELSNAPQFIEAEADDHIDDGDSALGDDATLASSTTSIGSSILKNRTENGRTYHSYKAGKYVLPNDEVNVEIILDDNLQHHIYSLAYKGKLFLCPIDKDYTIHRVLDVGTGTGIWAIDYADEHPESKVLGIDLSAIQPAFLPPNANFEIDDIEEEWTFTSKFDFIHARMMTGSLADWPKFFSQAFAHTSPGGYIELSDSVFPCECDDNSVTPSSALLRWSTLLLEASQKLGRDIDSAKRYKAQLEAAGYVDVIELVHYWPMNRWPKDPKFKELGMWNCENMLTGLSGFSMALFTRVLGMSAEEVEVYIVDARKEMKDTKIHAKWPM